MPQSSNGDNRKTPSRTAPVLQVVDEADGPVAARGRAQPKPGDQPAPRNLHFEHLLCQAVAGRLLVELRYDNDLQPRLFAPHIVYHSTTGRINVGGTQVENPQQPLDSFEPRIFEIGLIRTLRLTDTNFRPDRRFDPQDPLFRHGIICSV